MDELADRPVLAIDFGGTQIRAALITPDLAVHARRAVATRDEEGVEAVVARICEVAAEVRADAQAAGLPAPVGIGISAPGPLDPWRGVVVSPPNLAAWHDVPLAASVSRALDLPAFLGTLPIVNERIGDPAFAGGTHRPQVAASATQGALRP